MALKDREACWKCAPDIPEAVRRDKLGELKALKIAGFVIMRK